MSIADQIVFLGKGAKPGGLYGALKRAGRFVKQNNRFSLRKSRASLLIKQFDRLYIVAGSLVLQLKNVQGATVSGHSFCQDRGGGRKERRAVRCERPVLMIILNVDENME